MHIGWLQQTLSQTTTKYSIKVRHCEAMFVCLFVSLICLSAWRLTKLGHLRWAAQTENLNWYVEDRIANEKNKAYNILIT